MTRPTFHERLTPQQIQRIAKCWREGIEIEHIAERFGITCGAVSNIAAKYHLPPRARAKAARLAASTVSALLMLGIAHAAAPEGADPNSPTAQWYKSLIQPGTAYSCCDLSDCRPVSSRIIDDHYEVLIDKRFTGAGEPAWVPVPPDKILDHTSNPTGSAVACWRPGRGVMCFVRPTET